MTTIGRIPSRNKEMLRKVCRLRRETALTNIRKSRAMIGAYSFLRGPHARASTRALVLPRYWLITRRPPGLSRIVDGGVAAARFVRWWKGSRCLLIRTMLATCTNSSLAFDSRSFDNAMRRHTRWRNSVPRMPKFWPRQILTSWH